MTIIAERIRELASRTESRSPFLTLYLDTNRGDGSRQDRIRLLMRHEMERVRQALGHNGQQELVEKGVREIETYLNDSVDPAMRGVAVFAAPAEEFFLPLQLPVAVEPQLNIGSRPHVRQLARLRARHPHLLVALVDAKNARLVEVEMGRVVREINLEDPDVPNKTDQGGWSQANIQRHIQDHINHHHKDVADQLTRLYDGNPSIGLIVSGQERNVANFAGYLPKRLQDALLGNLKLDIRASADEIVEEAETMIRSRREERLHKLVSDLEEATRKNGRGALGKQQVIEAVNQRKLEQLFIGQDSGGRGWKCVNCAVIGETIPLGCPACGEPVLTVDLVEQFISAAENESAEVIFIDGSALLDRHQGVGALLRF